MRKPFAFVVMPFRSEFDDVYEIGIRDAASAAGVDAERLDDQMFTESMLDQIFGQIDRADIIIADMTGRNPNVFYEVGYAHAREKITILLAKEIDDIPFDLKHRRHIVYQDSLVNLRLELQRHLQWAATEVERRKKIGLRVEFESPVGSLDNSGISVKAICKITVNLTGTASGTTLSGITLYGNNWQVRQDGRSCPSTKSDLPDWKLRYFLQPPVTRVERDAWAPLNFEAERFIRFRNSSQPDPTELVRNVQGMLRIATAAGSFDESFYFDKVTFESDEIPF